MQDEIENTVHFVRKRPQIIRTVNLRTVLAVLAVVSFIVCLAVALVFAAPAGRRFTVKGRTFYGLVTGVYQTETEAAAASARVRQAGGGGYVFASPEGFAVLAAVYGSEGDADTVLARYPSAGYSKLALAVPSVKFDCFDEREDDKLAAALFRYPYVSLFDGLYEAGLSLDKAEISESLMLYTAAGYKTRAAEHLEKLRGLLRGHPTSGSLAALETLYTDTLALLDTVLSGEGKPAVRLKSALCALAVRSASVIGGIG